jgi:flavin-binding protein dodecin
MSKTYKKIEIVGTASESFAKAADNGIRKAAESLHNLDWFEVDELRGRIEGGKIAEYQVTLKIGLRVD